MNLGWPRARLLFLHIEVFLLQDDYNVARLTILGLFNLSKIGDLDNNA